MTQYIDKDALVVEIEERKDNLISLSESCPANTAAKSGFYAQAQTLEGINNFINTLEVKEVDWDALSVLANHLIACDAHGITPKYSDRELYFLEGLTKIKAQKGK